MVPLAHGANAICRNLICNRERKLIPLQNSMVLGAKVKRVRTWERERHKEKENKSNRTTMRPLGIYLIGISM